MDSRLSVALKYAAWVPVAIAMNDLFASVAVVRGASMSPTLNPGLAGDQDDDDGDRASGNLRQTAPPPSIGDRLASLPVADCIVLDRYSVRAQKYERGDVVVLKSPQDTGEAVVKRLVGLEGDWVRARAKSAPAVPASALSSAETWKAQGDASGSTTRLGAMSSPSAGWEAGELVFVPRGHCWVEGDNGRVSTDSNAYGPVPMALLDSRVAAVMWPPWRVRWVEREADEMAKARQAGRRRMWEAQQERERKERVRRWREHEAERARAARRAATKAESEARALEAHAKIQVPEKCAVDTAEVVAGESKHHEASDGSRQTGKAASISSPPHTAVDHR